jgi:signal transduction histidine kinase
MVQADKLQWAMAIAMGGMLMMAFFVIAFVVFYQKRQLAQEKQIREIERAHQKKLLETALNTEEAERRRIAKDLHDDIGTMLSLTKLSLNQLEQGLSNPGSQSQQTLHNARSLVEDTILNVRRITRDLVPVTLEKFGLAVAIEEFVRRISQGGELQVYFNCEGEEIPRQSRQIELTLFRVMQELVNNALKHAECTEIEIDLHKLNDRLELQVTDNGRGFDITDAAILAKGGLGLRSIESRLSVVNGSIKYETPGTKGTRAHVRIPIELS